jgi:acyl-coenzyme A synthetase/AMP-(fatty) acid ligase
VPLYGSKIDFIRVSDALETHDSLELLEAVVDARSPDRPLLSDCFPSTRDFRTGDLFSVTSQGRYIFRGRDDDWIKTEQSLRCNARSIEVEVLATCQDVVGQCVALGTGRPSPSLIIEALPGSDTQNLAVTVANRISESQCKRYQHEKITDPRLILIVETGEIPRTSVS